jgi:hypothetical protein
LKLVRRLASEEYSSAKGEVPYRILDMDFAEFAFPRGWVNEALSGGILIQKAGVLEMQDSGSDTTLPSQQFEEVAWALLPSALSG